MRILWCVVLSIALLGSGRSPHGIYASGPIAVAIVQLPGGASIQNAGQTAAIAELGTVSANLAVTSPGVEILPRPRSYVVVTAIGLRATSQGLPGPVSIQAFLDEPLAGGAIVRIDGVQLGTFPQTIATQVQLNVVTRHRLELEIPNSLHAGMLPSEIPLEFGATAQ